jgi:uncharacterized membrane protein
MIARIFWVGQSAQFKYIKTCDRNITWINLLFLLFVSVLPFSTAFLGDHIALNFRYFYILAKYIFDGHYAIHQLGICQKT